MRERRRFAGIDLAALPKNETGACLYDGISFHCETLRGDGEIVAFVERAAPGAVAIDAPLTLPAGRCCWDDACCGPRKARECDRMMMRRGFKVFPAGYSFMKQLTLRGKGLKELLAGYRVIESHPRTIMRLLGPVGFGDAPRTEHERDACALALMAMLYDRGEYEEIGDEEGVVVLPRVPEGKRM